VDCARELALRRVREFAVGQVELTARDAPDAVGNRLAPVETEGLFSFALRVCVSVPRELAGDRCGANDRRGGAYFPARAAVCKGDIRP
jgi:hypothetical protein